MIRPHGLVAIAAVLAFAGTANAQIYYGNSDTDTIHRINEDGTGDVLLASSTVDPNTLVVSDAYIWWVSGNSAPSGTINRLDRSDGSHPMTFLPIEGVYWSVDYNPIDDKVYYVSNTGVGRMNQDGSGSETLWTGTPDGFSGFAVDGVHRKMYWHVPGGGFGLMQEHNVVRANLDGSGVETILTGMYGNLLEIAVDPRHGRLYVSGTTSTELGMTIAGLDGSSPMSFLTSRFCTDFAVDALAGKVFVGSTIGIAQSNLDGSGSGSVGSVSNALAIGVYAPIPIAQIVTAQHEPAGSNCTDGGVALTIGLDVNADGVIESDESSTTEYVCNGAAGATGPKGATGADGATALVTTTNELAGTNCANGGVRVDVGVDQNANSTLDSGEIQQTTYVCNGTAGAMGMTGTTGTAGTTGATGATGAAGPSGKNSLIQTSTEAAGANCANGGLRVDTGVDANSDAMLTSDEITHTSYLCTPDAVTTKSGGCTAAGSTSSAPTWAFGVIAVMAFLSRRRAR